LRRWILWLEYDRQLTVSRRAAAMQTFSHICCANATNGFTRKRRHAEQALSCQVGRHYRGKSSF
jgi:hypothetical protein